MKVQSPNSLVTGLENDGRFWRWDVFLGEASRGVEKALSLQSGTFGMLALSFTSCVTVANDLASLPHFTHV